MPQVISFSTEALAEGSPAAVSRLAAQVTDACYEALVKDGSTYLVADGTAVALIVPLPPEEE